MFDWDHRDESTKCKGGFFGKHGGVAGLVHNHANAATLDKVRDLARRTFKYAPSATVF